MLASIFPTQVFAFSDLSKSETIVDLIAGQHIDAGDIEVKNDSEKLYVKYIAAGDWCLEETHLQVASSLDDIPQANGNPIPGLFDYQDSHGCKSDYTYTIPLTEFSCDLYIAAHAVVKNKKGSTETAWGSGIDFPGNNWATYFMYTVEGCVVPEPSLSLVKEGTLDLAVVEPSDQADVGDVINYRVMAINDGNVTLSNVVISDPILGDLSCTPTQPASLAVGETVVCTGSYTLKQTDLNNGSVENTASVDSDQTPPQNRTIIIPLEPPVATGSAHEFGEG